MRIVVALGDNARLGRGERTVGEGQRDEVEPAARGLAALAAEHQLVVTHGNGPEVNYLELALRNALPGQEVVTVLTAVVVAGDDPAPRAIVELRSLRRLIDAGALVVCADGDGIPVAVDESGAMRGVETVVDKDLTAALLARRLDADLLMMLTDVRAVQLDRGEDSEVEPAGVTPTELRQRSFAAGSMRPRVEAACRFVELTGRRAAIGSLADAVAIARGEAGTQVAPLSA